MRQTLRIVSVQRSLRPCNLVQHLLFFFNDTATTEIYTLSLHDALPICKTSGPRRAAADRRRVRCACGSHIASVRTASDRSRSEEHTSELQSQSNLVCRLLLEKKNRLSLSHFTTFVPDTNPTVSTVLPHT